jgi:hypothetical protein
MVREFFYALPVLERGRPLFRELLWVLAGCPDEGQHIKTLPEYCYHIFEAVRKTHFKNFPALTDIIYIRDPAALADAKTIEAAKKVIQMDWKNMGRACGIGMRCWRFAKMEAEDGVDGEGFDGLSPEKVNEVFLVIFGQQWIKENEAKVATESPDKILADALNYFMGPWLQEVVTKGAMFNSIACQWSPTAMQEFHEGFAEGLNSFIDEQSQLVGGTDRTGTYAFLALAWPEVKAMQESQPKRKTLSDLHEWLLPFMRVGVMPYLDIDQLRDICAPPPSGIGLALRPLKKASAAPSA